jgi:3-oxoacyl-[acyl-carrier-protein] synthase III
MIRSRIISTAKYLPPRVMTNADIEKFCDTTDEWIQQRTGIEQRHFAEEGQATSDLALEASKIALDRAGIKPEELDSIILCTLTPDHQLPATASIVQDRLGAKYAAACDLNAACSGFLYGLRMADGVIRAGHAKNVLLVAAEVASSALVWEARDTAVLFGDGAGAVVLRADEGDCGVLSSYLRSDGSGKEILWVPGGGSRIPFKGGTYNVGDRTPIMNGKELFKKAVLGMAEAVEKALEQSGVSADEVDIFVPHQANKRIIDSAASRLTLPAEKIIININRVGNTIAASIPIALDDAVEQNLVKQGDHVLFASFGAGLTWGSSMVKW